jgi:hypothetical protein
MKLPLEATSPSDHPLTDGCSDDLHITLGFIEQHLMLGFSGGRKLVAPGLAAQETIKVIHSPLFMREPMATEGSIADNPLHAQLHEIARMAGHDFMLDVTLTQSREVSGIFAGDPVEAHAAGVRFLRTTSLEKLSGLADAVITSAAGHPLDLTFYQTIKGLTAAQHIVKPGGRILILGECAEGVGSPEFARTVAAFSGYDSFLDQIRNADVVVDQWQLEKMALAGQKYGLFFYRIVIPIKAPMERRDLRFFRPVRRLRHTKNRVFSQPLELILQSRRTCQPRAAWSGYPAQQPAGIFPRRQSSQTPASPWRVNQPASCALIKNMRAVTTERPASGKLRERHQSELNRNGR